MELHWLPIAMVALLSSGCTHKTEPDLPIPPTEVKKPLPTTADRLFDSFHLPLVIHIDLPEIPTEIQNSSPPIEENLGPPMKIDDPKIENPSPPTKQESELP